MNQPVRQTHLEYYREHQITPVRYDMSDLNAHMERRCSLYTKLGLAPLAFKKAKILEVAAGTGHNSLYLAQLMPSRLILLEPNESGVQHIKQSYLAFSRPHTSPDIIVEQLENYSPQEKFDIVLCENWLGSSPHELSLIHKLSEMVNLQGMLVLTTVSPAGFVPNLLRRFLSIYLAPQDQSFMKRTETLISAFGSHLDTLHSMTRNKTDWVQDNMLNPAYFGLCLSIPNLVSELGDEFAVIGSSPSFSEDWRWFKSLSGNLALKNEHFLSEYWKKSHNFLDHRESPSVGDSEVNRKLEEAAFALLAAIAAHEDAHLQRVDVQSYTANVLHSLDDFIELVPSHFVSAYRGLNEMRELVASPLNINIDSVMNMENFSGLFGRETVYVSFMRGQ